MTDEREKTLEERVAEYPRWEMREMTDEQPAAVVFFGEAKAERHEGDEPAAEDEPAP